MIQSQGRGCAVRWRRVKQIVIFLKKITKRNFKGSHRPHWGTDTRYSRREELGSLLGGQHLGAAHVGLEDGGDLHSAVRLEVILQESNEHPGRGDHSVVQGVGQVGALLPP